MPKPKIILDRYALDELRSHISLKAGFVIAGKSDCVRLADLMNKSDIGPISPSTLYRLFFKLRNMYPIKIPLTWLVSLLDTPLLMLFTNKFHLAGNFCPDQEFT